MDFILDAVINRVAHRMGVFALSLLTGGRFKGERGSAWGLALAVGSMIVLAPFAATVVWFIYHSGR